MNGVTAGDVKQIQEEGGILHKGCPFAGNIGSSPMYQTIRRTRLDSGGLHVTLGRVVRHRFVAPVYMSSNLIVPPRTNFSEVTYALRVSCEIYSRWEYMAWFF